MYLMLSRLRAHTVVYDTPIDRSINPDYYHDYLGCYRLSPILSATIRLQAISLGVKLLAVLAPSTKTLFLLLFVLLFIGIKTAICVLDGR
mmetsp:Transcript_17192/g.37616  ORF Transcript_17192/g.37616 Transcript_17192/m.37616 type:complete len:90 (+) Transcript_17192:233-502(+)